MVNKKSKDEIVAAYYLEREEIVWRSRVLARIWANRGVRCEDWKGRKKYSFMCLRNQNLGIKLKFKSYNTESKQKEVLFYVYVTQNMCMWMGVQNKNKNKVNDTVRINSESVTSACALRGWQPNTYRLERGG